MTPRNYNIIDAADELRRIGPQIGAAVRELDRLCERLPQEIVNRIEAAAPEVAHLDAHTGAKLSELAQGLQVEIDAMPDDEYEAMMQQVEARRCAARQRQFPEAVVGRLVFGTPPRISADDVLSDRVLPMARFSALQGGTDGEAA